MCSLFKTFILFVLFATAHCSNFNTVNYRAKPAQKEADTLKSSLCSHSPVNMERAWEATEIIPGRNPNIFRLYGQKNVILYHKMNKSKYSSLSYCVKVEYSKGVETFVAVKNGSSTSLPYNFEAEYIMNLVEIALFGYISDEFSNSVCYSPSEIHQSLMKNDQSALEWQNNLCKGNPIYGRYGHEFIFDKMGLRLNNIYKYPRSSALYVRDNVPQCSDYVLHFNPVERSKSTTSNSTDLESLSSLSEEDSVISLEPEPPAQKKARQDEVDADGFTAVKAKKLKPVNKSQPPNVLQPVARAAQKIRIK